MNTFGWAIKEMHNGARVRRAGWNGKGMYIAIQPGSTILPAQARDGVAKFMADDGAAEIKILPHIDMKSAQNEVVVGWLASQTDMLSADWEIATPTVFEREGYCGICGEKMPAGEEVFKFHGFSGPCPKKEAA